MTPDSTNSNGRPYPYMIYRNMEALKLVDTSTVVKVGDTNSDIKKVLQQEYGVLVLLLEVQIWD